MSLSIKKKLIIFSVGIAACVCALLALLSTRSLTEQTRLSVDNELHQVGQATRFYISQWMTNKADLLLANEPIVANIAEPKSHLLVTAVAGSFMSVYTAYSDGGLIFSDEKQLPAGFDARTRPWYLAALAQRNMVITPPYQDVDGAMVVTLAQQFTGGYQGVLAADLTIDDIIQVVRETRLNNQGFAFLVDSNNQLLAYRDASITGQPLTSLGQSLTQTTMDRLAADNIMFEFQSAADNKAKWLAVFDIPGTDWRLGMVMDKDTAMQAVEQQAQLTLLLSLALFAVVAVLTAWIIGKLLLPLQQLKQAVDELSQGDADLSHRLTLVRQDEIGEVAQSVNRFIALLQQLIGDIATSTHKLDGLVLAAGHNVTETTRAVEHQRSQVDQVATAIHEMSVSAREVASHAEMTADAAKSSADACEQGQAIITENLNAIGSVADKLQGAEHIIRELDSNVQGIHRILSNIQSIADQTNLLALNAAIEAARAGAQGRGFAVVADEVRVLSQRTHTATEEVSAMIKMLQHNAQQAVTAMEDSADEAKVSVDCANRASERLGEITVAITQITTMAIQIASAAEQQRAVSEEISRNTQEVREAADDVASQAQNSEQQCQQIRAEAGAINQEINRFRLS